MLPCLASAPTAGGRPLPRAVIGDNPESIQLCRLRPLSARDEPMEAAVGEAAGGEVWAECAGPLGEAGCVSSSRLVAPGSWMVNSAPPWAERPARTQPPC